MAYFDKYGVEFSDDRKTLVKCPEDFKGEYTIPEGVTCIWDTAFYRCKDLTFVTLPNSVTSIGDDAFWGCSSLKSVSIPYRVTNIGDCAFAYCSALTSIVIPNSVTSIGDYAFACCSALSCSVTIGIGITFIGKRAFADCNNLKEICVPRGQKARFTQMDGLKEFSDIIVERDDEELIILTNLAKAYEKGIGVTKSITQAFLIHTQAADKGSAESAYRLAEWYYEGKVIPCDLNKALAYFQQAAKTGYLDADNKVIEVQEYIVKEKQLKMSEFIADVNNKREKALIQHNRAKREKEAEDFEYEHDLPSYSQYGGYNGYDDDTIDSAFEGDPEATWNVD